MASRIGPADLDKMMGIRPGVKQTITKGKKSTIRHPVVRRKRRGTRGLLRPK